MKTEDIRIEVGGQHYFPARYLHAEFDRRANCFRHFDGAIQLFTEEVYFQRRDSDFNMTIKSSAHIKAGSNKGIEEMIHCMSGVPDRDTFLDFLG